MNSPHNKSAAKHWLHDRLVAAALVPVMLWLVWSVIRMPSWSYSEFIAWLGQPLNTVLMIAAVAGVFFHAASGSREIVEDYIHHEGFKKLKLTGINLFFVAAGLACILSILKVALAG